MTAAGPDHLLIAPILVPLVAGALMLLYDDRRRTLKAGIGLASVLGLVLISVQLLARVRGGPETAGTTIGLYLLGDWPMPYGIILVLDRLSAMMVTLSALLALPVVIYSGAGWHGRGQHFHSLLQFLLAGLNGAFLTGDLFNLFVFFEVLLAASYGLMLHGSGPARIKAGLHYIVINLAASLLFLVGVALVYGVTGTLNMAEIAHVVRSLPEAQRPLLHMGAAMLALAFLAKAGAWPLCFWLMPAYSAATPPVAAMFAIMTKVGIYALLRLGLLVFGPGSGASAGFGAPVLVGGGLATMAFGLIALLGARDLPRQGGALVLISSGTLLAVLGLALAGGSEAMLSGALYYLVGSTAAVSAFFLLAEPIARNESSQDAPEPDPAGEWAPMDMGSPDDPPEEERRPATTRPASLTAAGICFFALAVVLAGLPPLSGFVGKFAMIAGLLSGLETLGPTLSAAAWAFVALLLIAGFATLVALSGAGIRRFWAEDGPAPRILALEIGPVMLLLAMIVLLTLRAQAALGYMDAAARALLRPNIYITAIITAPRVAEQAETAAGTETAPATEGSVP